MIRQIFSLDEGRHVHRCMQTILLASCRWCAAKPVATNGFTLAGMKANTHLVNISVRCQNEVGWSDPSEVVPEAFTEGNLAVCCLQ